MKIYIKLTENSYFSVLIKIAAKQQIRSTMSVWRDKLKYDYTRFILDGEVSMDDLALFPIFYQEDKHSVCVVDKLKENTFYLNKSRYTLMYVWELEDIESGVDSDNVAYQAFVLDRYYKEMNDVCTDGYAYLGKYDVITNKLTIDFNYNEQ